MRAASKGRVVVSQRCGGNGSCTMCKVFISPDSCVSQPKEVERRMLGDDNLASGMRLACQTLVQGTVKVEVPESPLKAYIRAQLRSQKQGE
ncbi:2Fe-2S iron-sulfur cluster-binding protein [Aneurinibacillus terranovensis]|uniref:2Fe-2S iron-sulfur cluster-binding protein n=1 Tax=Aneurinibacillus terranovensis TaxID=278991 RepID=UPI003CCB82B9